MKADSAPAPASSSTTTQGGNFHTIKARKLASASAKSRPVSTALVHTGV